VAQLLRGFLAVVEEDIRELHTSIDQLKTSQEEMVRTNATVAEQLKAAQEQMVRDNAAVAEQLKATQEQLARLIAKDSEQPARAKTTRAPPPQAIVTASVAKRVPKISPPQTTAQRPAQVRGRPE
jgi:hypothetical protein